MKIRRPWLIWLVAFFGAWLVRLWVWTVRYRYYHFGPDVRPQHLVPGERYIYAFWHEFILMPAYYYGQPDILVLISQHADGELIAQVCRHLGFGLVRGSTTRGGVEAVRRMLQSGKAAHLAITPDGPRGPRRQLHAGLIYVAARTGLPIVPIGFGFQHAWRTKSWDQFAIPRPWSLAICVTGTPISVPADAEKDQLEHYCQLVETAMAQATRVAEECAALGGHWSEDDAPEILRPSAGLAKPLSKAR
jgi:lysophospholipid acyltransferase (LPLAT)-like uncharacterized protein